MSNSSVKRIITVSEHNNYVLLDDMNDIRSCKIFSVDKIIKEMLDAYNVQDRKTDYLTPDKLRKIHNQVSIDYPRMQIYYNSVRPNTVESYLFMLRKLRNIPHNILPSMYHVIVLFSMQAPFFYHFSYLNELLGELDDVYLVQDGSPSIVEIIHRGESINLILKKSFKRINIRTNEIYDKYDTTMMINLTKLFSFGIISSHEMNHV